jgi:hypothetical protein
MGVLLSLFLNHPFNELKTRFERSALQTAPQLFTSYLFRVEPVPLLYDC